MVPLDRLITREKTERMLMRKIIEVTFLLLIALPCLSQSASIEAHKKVLIESKEDSNKVNALLALSNEHRSSNPTRAVQYAMEAKNLSEKINYLPGLAYSYKGLGLVYVMQGKYIETIENYEKALAVFDSLDDRRGQANILSNVGTVYFNQADDAKALEFYLKALRVAEQTTDSARLATILVNIGAVYAHKTATYDKALEYYFKALPISQSLDDKNIIGTVNSNIGELYLLRGNVEPAVEYFKTSLKDYGGSENTPYALNNLGKAYQQKGDYATALKYHQQAYDFSLKLDAPLDVAQSLLGQGDTYMLQGNAAQAIRYYKEAEPIALKISPANTELKIAYAGLALAYNKQEDFSNAYKYQTLYSGIKDSLYNIDTDKKLTGLQFVFDIQKKQAQVDLLTKDKALQQLDLKRQRMAKNALSGGLLLVFIITLILYRNYRNKIKVNKILDRQNAEIESLILNILPGPVAKELQKTGNATPRFYERASVLFTDFKNFSKFADELSPQEVVTELSECFVGFDEIIERNKLEKIKTIGDSYMCAGGIPIPDDGHPIAIVKAGLEIQEFIKERNEKRRLLSLPPWDVRIGINTGPLVAGVVGKKKYAYDIWGATVNVASRLESNGEPGRINISAATYELVKHKYACTYRGRILAKNVGEVEMYFIENEVSLEPVCVDGMG